MSEPLKPRIDFDGPLQAEKTPPLKSARAFDRLEADNFAPARLVTGEEEEGAAEAVVESVLRPKRSLWRRMVSAGLAIFGVSVVAQGVQWTANAWQTQDWIALGGCVAGALIVGAGVGTVATQWRRLWRLRQRYDEAARAPIHLEKGAEMGRFKLGSTVILLFGADRIDWEAGLGPLSPVRMGQRLGMARD